ncbi:hypothetical protein N8A88_22185 [Pseudomonas shahriarae]|uniref:hypothetical protein n=1 Tax=Pseudomonas shahriarae TaxID=2745512 RepID=UPI0021C58B66|nr:hypothetical protein [Pseudomonas shahriarae]MCU0213302.1 hypothetical protein [Pseudomonas shahriarae]
MTKIHITIEDSTDGVSISVHSPNPLHSSKAGQVATAMLHGGRLIARIPFDPTAQHVGCDCEICQAMREKLTMKPTIH